MSVKKTATANELPTLEDSLTFIRGNYNELYPIDESRRKTIGNLPARLHDDIKQIAETKNLNLFEVVAGLLDFYTEYELQFEADLSAQRAKTPPRR